MLRIKVVYDKKNDISYITKAGSYHYNSFPNLLFNGECPKETWMSSWGKVSGRIESVERKVQPQVVSRKYVLVDDSFSDRLPKELPVEEDEDGYRCVPVGYAQYSSLYEIEETLGEESVEPVEYEISVSEDYEEVPKFSEVLRKQLESFKVSIGSDDDFMIPSILKHTSPIVLTVDETFEIIREYVKRNIDNRHARVTSDYKFSFAVSKCIHYDKPIVVKKEIKKSNGKSYARPKFRTEVIKHKSHEFFKMGDRANNYGPPPKPFSGRNAEELCDNIDKYLKDLVEKINEPLYFCTHCDGTGVILSQIDLEEGREEV